MKKALGILAVLGLVAAPAMADLSSGLMTNPQLANLAPIPAGHGSVGAWRPIYYTGYGTYYGIYGQSEIYAAPSDLVTVTFAFHWPFTEAVLGRQLWTSLQWDNSEVEVVSVTPVGVWAGTNIYTTQHTIHLGYSTIGHTSLSGTGTVFVTTDTFLFPDPFWTGPSSGTITVGDVLGTTAHAYPLWQNPTSITTYVAGSSFFPFMQVQMHVKSVNPDGLPDVIIKSAAMLFYRFGFSGLWFTGGGLGATSWGEDIVPEPASLSLLGFGVVAIGAGVWRRRRR